MKHQFSHIIFSMLLVACGTEPASLGTSTLTQIPTNVFTPTAAPTETPRPPFEYRISYGDTCVSIAENFKISVEQLIDFNNLPSSCSISINQILHIPHSTTSLNITSPTPFFQSDSLLRAWQTKDALATPIRTSVVPPQSRKISSAYIENGNLYFVNDTGQNVQLTNSGEDHDVILSDDAQMIAFYRGEDNKNLHFINLDGTQEQSISTSTTPLLLGKGVIVSPVFLPDAHTLLFNTYLCGIREGLYNGPDCSIDLYRINVDTGKLENVVEKLSGSTTHGKNFEISPSGRYVAVAGSGSVNIYDLSSEGGNIKYTDVLTYHITPPDEYLPKQYWLPDSSGLVIIRAADNESNDPSTPPALYEAFRYIIRDHSVVKIPLDKFIVWDMQQDSWLVSPDRNWILFAGNETADRSGDSLHYLGSLVDGGTQAYEPIGWLTRFSTWSPDSKHFTYPGLIGSVDGSPPVRAGGLFIEWIDATYYYYGVDDIDGYKIYKGQIGDQ